MGSSPLLASGHCICTQVDPASVTVTYRNVQRWPVAGATSLRCHCGVFLVLMVTGLRLGGTWVVVGRFCRGVPSYQGLGKVSPDGQVPHYGSG